MQVVLVFLASKLLLLLVPSLLHLVKLLLGVGEVPPVDLLVPSLLHLVILLLGAGEVPPVAPLGRELGALVVVLVSNSVVSMPNSMLSIMSNSTVSMSNSMVSVSKVLPLAFLGAGLIPVHWPELTSLLVPEHTDVEM